MTEQEAREFSYDDAVRIRAAAQQLEPQLARIITEARADGRSAARIARDLDYTEGRVYQILRDAKKAADPAE
ncbi:hypothetical protein OHV05_15330 [Kitasatospora sp. NBC_00070]|uniref:sigma factor-like helix-turn-helix DNA-binding protein n=1 Tax=Kitasatospora sp. NBC_00070 TaxID=2975962 RepID=UPI0032488F15